MNTQNITKRNIRFADYVRKVRLQQRIEERFSKAHIHGKVVESLVECPPILDAMEKATALINTWLEGEYYESKQYRINQLKLLNIQELVQDITAVITMRCTAAMPIVNIASMCAGQLKMADKGQAIHTMAELIAVMADADLYDLHKPTPHSSVLVTARIQLDEDLAVHANYAQFLPPSIVQPRKLRTNSTSGYITQNGDSLILGGFENYHDQEIGLDVLNTMNRNQYEIDIEFITTVDEPMTNKTAARLNPSDEDWENMDRLAKQMLKLERDNYEEYRKQCYFTYVLMIHNGNKFHFNHKVDKRGRIYSVGYHLNPQGNSFKKAMLNFKKAEVINDLPDWAVEL